MLQGWSTGGQGRPIMDDRLARDGVAKDGHSTRRCFMELMTVKKLAVFVREDNL